MNADGRRWICRSLVVALISAAFLASAQSEEFQSKLGAEIERRFEDSAIQVDNAPLEFGCEFSKYVASRLPVPVDSQQLRIHNRHARWMMFLPFYRSQRLDEPASLPRPTFVERQIAKGFPSGEAAKGDEAPDDGYSYLLAEDEFTFGGLTFSR
jgi:hypothetical protein